MMSWSIYLSDIPAKWLGLIEAITAERAIQIAAEKFGQESKRLTAFLVGSDP
jgi:hypothetical protein